MTETKILEETVAAETGPRKAGLTLDGKDYELPVVTAPKARRDRHPDRCAARPGAITLDPGYGNTGACQSAITFIDGEKGILRYRGYPIEELAEQRLVPRDRLPADLRRAADRSRSSTEFRARAHAITRLLHEDMKQLLRGVPARAPTRWRSCRRW